MLSFTAEPLKGYSSLHKMSLFSLFGKKSRAFPYVTVVFDFNLHTPIDTQNADLTFHIRDAAIQPNEEESHFSITNLTRWRLNLKKYDSFDKLLQNMKNRHYTRYINTEKTFSRYKAEFAFIENDWSENVDEFYQLYLKVAEKHGTQLYDLEYFRQMAKQPNCKLMSVTYKGKLIAALMIIEEGTAFHSVVCGLDYDHSTKCLAYSWLHYEFIRQGINANCFDIADVGLTANEAKSMLDFQPVDACLDVKAHNRVLRGVLRLISPFMTATIDTKAQLKFNFHLPKNHNIDTSTNLGK